MTEIKTMNNKDFAVLVYDTAKHVSDINPVFVAAQAALESAKRTAALGARQSYLGVVNGLAQVRALLSPPFNRRASQ